MMSEMNFRFAFILQVSAMCKTKAKYYLERPVRFFSDRRKVGSLL